MYGSTKSLVIVENPLKAKILRNILAKEPSGASWNVFCTYGKLYSFSKSARLIDPSPKMESNSKKLLKSLREAIFGATRIFIATDPSFYGTEVSGQVAVFLSECSCNIPLKRVFFLELTEKCVFHGLSHAKDFDESSYNKTLTKRLSDRFFHAFVDDLLTKQFNSSISISRVSLYLLAFVCKHWFNRSIFDKKSYTLDFDLNGLKFSSDERFDLSQVTGIYNSLMLKPRIPKIVLSESKDCHQVPQLLHLKSMLLGASETLHIGVGEILLLAQKLYDSGLITFYHVSSSNCRLSSKNISIIRAWILSAIDDAKYVVDSVENTIKDKCIRPTNINFGVANIDDPALRRLYQFIWSRTIASQSVPAKVADIQLKATFPGVNLSFSANTSRIIFDGFYRFGVTTPLEIPVPVAPFPAVSFMTTQYVRDRLTLVQLLDKTFYADSFDAELFDPALQSLIRGKYLSIDEDFRIAPTTRGLVLFNFLHTYAKNLVSYKDLKEFGLSVNMVQMGGVSRHDFLRMYKQYLTALVTPLENMKFHRSCTRDVCSKCGKNLSLMFPADDAPYLLCDDTKVKNKGCGSSFNISIDNYGKIHTKKKV